jgi:hypothetical protein
MKTIKAITPEGEQFVQVKTDYKELSYDELRRLLTIEAVNPEQRQIEILEIITGFKGWEQVAPESVDQVYQFANYLQDKPKIKTRFKVGEKEVDISDIKIEFKAFGAKLLYQKNYNDFTENKITFEEYCKLGAKIYIQSVISDRYSESEIESIDLSNLEPIDIILINDFFLCSLLNSQQKKKS